MQWKEGRILKMDYNKNDDPFLLKVPKKFMEEALQVASPILSKVESLESGQATGPHSIPWLRGGLDMRMGRKDCSFLSPALDTEDEGSRYAVGSTGRGGGRG